MAKGDYVSFKVEQYKPGMENDAQFEAVSFRFPVPEDSKGDIKLTNKFRGEKIREYCKLYDVKPLGAAAPASKKVDKNYMGVLWQASDKQTRQKNNKHYGKSDTEMATLLLQIYKIKFPAHEVTEADFMAMRTGIDQAEELLAAV